MYILLCSDFMQETHRNQTVAVAIVYSGQVSEKLGNMGGKADDVVAKMTKERRETKRNKKCE